MLEVWAIFAIAVLPWALLFYLRSRRFLHILQLEEYMTRDYVRWLGSNYRRYLRPRLYVGVLFALFFGFFGVVEELLVASWGLVGAVLVWLHWQAPKAKKPLVMTSRARRLLGVSLAISAVVSASFIALAFTGDEDWLPVSTGLLVIPLLALSNGHLVALANLLLWPLEERTRRRFQRMAEQKLRERRPKIIAITGSAGKTTTKELVAHMLAARYWVLRTPSSFNTPMGISRTVNDSLTDQDYFVVEMGAYTKGEIAKLCRLVGGTDVSVITTVNAQHLERFGSLEKTAEAKYEIVEGLKPGGTAVLNLDVPAVRQLAQRFPDIDILTFGVESEDVRLRAMAVREQEGGIEVDVAIDGQTATVRAPLLGRHNATNILAAIGVGLTCGLDLPYMAAALRTARPPEHRLQPMTLPTGAIYLDDGYNGNPQGIIGALEVLGSYAPRRRIVITPGLIEMGRDRAQYHEAIGRAAAKHVDVAFLVGPKQTADIRTGMLLAGFPTDNVHTVRSLDEARDRVTEMHGWEAGNVVLVANDLPDQFDEFLVI